MKIWHKRSFLLAILLTLCPNYVFAEESNTIFGLISISQPYQGTPKKSCDYLPDHADIQNGGTVWVGDGDGDIIARGDFFPGSNASIPGMAGWVQCRVLFTAKVPMSRIYRIKLGDREPIIFTYEEMRSRYWMLRLTAD